ncbi:NepR family anti-sigma factor [Qipengyuania sp. SM2507]
MTSDRNDLDDRGSGGPRKREASQSNKPQWANGLRQLYDSVVEEDIPDQFKDLLSKLDAKD